MNADIFSLTFDILHRALKSQDDQEETSPNRGNVINRSEEKLNAAINLDLLSSAKKGLDSLKKLRKFSLNRYQSASDEGYYCLHSVKKSNVCTKQLCTRQYNIASRRLSTQQSNAERKMRELVFEIIGEYAKSNIRISRRQVYLKIAERVLLAWYVWKLKWERFALRLCYESYSNIDDKLSRVASNFTVFHNILCSISDSDEICMIENKVRLKVPSLSTADSISCVIRLSKVANNSTISTTSMDLEVPLVITSVSELAAVKDILHNWSSKSSSTKPSLSAAAATTTVGTIGIASSNNSNLSQDERYALDRKKLLAFLKSNTIDWIHPSSYCNTHWESLLPQLRHISMSAGHHGNDKVSQQRQQEDKWNGVDALDDFILQYSSQHTSTIASQRLFFCLEERAYASKANGIYPSSTSNDEAAAPTADTTTMMLLEFLQSFYIDTNSSTSRLTLDDIRRAIATEPLHAVDLLGSHRDKYKQHNNQLVSSYIKTYPDITRVTCSSGYVFHFCPALVINVPETDAFKDVLPNSDEVRTAYIQCPHPHLPLLATTDTSPITRLFCLSRIFPAILEASRNSSKDTASATASASGSGAIGSKSKISNSASLLIMLPLHDKCMNEIVKDAMWPSNNTMPLLLKEKLPTAIDLLPDRATIRSGSDALRCKYILYEDCTSGTNKRCMYLIQLTEESSVTNVPDSISIPSFKIDEASNTVTNDDYEDDFDAEDDAIADADTATYTGNSRRRVALGDSSDFNGRNDLLLQKALAIRKVHDLATNNTVSKSNAAAVKNQSSPMYNTSLPEYIDKIDENMLIPSADANYIDDTAATSTTVCVTNQQQQKKRRWDARVLSNICRWRSCLSDSCIDSSTKYLCAYHFGLKRFLDEKKSTEALRYLPRRAPNLDSISSSKKDLVMIRASSTLLQELWDGKLKSTLKVFAKKTVHDMSLRRHLEATTHHQHMVKGSGNDRSPSSKQQQHHASSAVGVSIIPPPPSWAKWMDDKLHTNTLDVLEVCEDNLDRVMQAEKALSQELNELYDLRVFPSTELALIRKEVKSFKEYQDSLYSNGTFKDGTGDSTTTTTSGNGNSDITTATAAAVHLNEYKVMATASAVEHRLCERKLTIIRARLQDEIDMREVARKKILRARNIEDMQSKDPANFRNQR